MEVIVPIAALIIIFSFVADWCIKRRNSAKEQLDNYYDEIMDSTNETTQSSAQQAEQTVSDENDTDPYKSVTLGLMSTILSNLGCNPIIENGEITVKYQGENFLMVIHGRYVRIWDIYWSKIEADDPDIPKIREAINLTNFNWGPTVLLREFSEENGELGFCSRFDLMLHPSCPDNEPYVKGALDSFFDAKQEVYRNFQQLKTQRKEGTASYRPIGFRAPEQV